MTLSALYLTRVGQLACYHRVVFDINGPRGTPNCPRRWRPTGASPIVG